MKNKAFKIVVALMALVMSISSIVTGCGGEEKKVATDGSTSMEKVIGILGESFTEANKDVTFTYNPTGFGSGIKAAKDGTCDIGFFADFLAKKVRENYNRIARRRIAFQQSDSPL